MRIGQYELLDRIGIGGMAEVFRARQAGEEGFERFVAIKRILPGISADTDFVKMFIDEAKIAVQLSHPNIAQIYDLGRDEETYYIAQEYVYGRDMGAIVKRQKASDAPLPIDFVVHVGMKVCEALQHAHTAQGTMGRPLNIIHRDVSPSNVIVSFEGAVKVIDFGLAKAVGRLATTQSGVVKGKLAYLSSEQARGESIDSRSDLFSLGTCLFEWLTGQRLFLRRSDPETVIAVQKAVVPPLRAIRRDVPAELQSIVKKALEPRPQNRFASAMEMHDALLSFSYDTRSVMRRGKVGEYLRALFPEEDGVEETDDRGPLPRTDTVQSVEVLLVPDHLDEEVTVDGGMPSASAVDAKLVEEMTSDFLRDNVFDDESDILEVDIDEVMEVPIVEDVVEDDIVATTQSGHRMRDALTRTKTGPLGFDDKTGDFKQEAVELAMSMSEFEDTTAPGKSRRKELAGEFGAEETKAIDPEALDAALAEVLATGDKPAAKKEKKPERFSPFDDFDDETHTDLEAELTSVEQKE